MEEIVSPENVWNGIPKLDKSPSEVWNGETLINKGNVLCFERCWNRLSKALVQLKTLTMRPRM
jgi:hypothetical protein